MTTEITTTPKRMFESLDIAQRPAALAEHAVKTEVQTVPIPYTDQEKIDFKDALSEISIKTQEAERIKAQALKEYSANIKLLDTQRRNIITQLKLGYKEQQETLYAIDDQEKGMMEYYRGDGELVHSRRLLPDERQTRIQ